MRVFVFLALGGALGTVGRYAVSGWVQPAAATFPWGTLAVNVVGSFALGFLMRVTLGVATIGPEMRLALTVGVCGGFTTMSTFAYETAKLLEGGEYLTGFGYAAGSAIGSIAAVFVGTYLAGRLL